MIFKHQTSADGGYTALIRGAEVHVQFHRPGVITRRSARALFAPIIEEHGMVTTKCAVADEATRRFLARLGFKPTWSDEVHSYFMTTALPFTKESQPCQQQ